MSPRLLRSLFLIVLAALLAALVPLLSRPDWLQTDLATLLPQDARPDAVWQAADAAQEKQMNSQILALIGSDTLADAIHGVEALSAQWQASGLFVQVESEFGGDLPALRGEIARLGVALLPLAQAQLLLHQPASYFQARGEALLNPFSAHILPPEADWLGVSRFVLDKAPASRLQWQDGRLMSHDGERTWLWLRGELQPAADGKALLALMDSSRETLAGMNAELLASSGALFAAHTRVQAEAESTRLSLLGVSLTFALLFAVFRRLRLLALFIPLACGMLAGWVATLALFAHIHILTLVIGTSLIGVLIDFPLHWLTPARYQGDWQAERAMQRIIPVFLISLAITALGYLLLAFTPLPVLRQTAVFSCAALIAAFAATVTLLPPLFRHYPPRAQQHRLPTPRLWPVFLLALFAIAGNMRGNWRDDIRDWARLAPELIAQTQTIARLSGLDSGGRYLLVQADSEDALLHRDARTLATLETLRTQGIVSGAQGISQWLLPTDIQRALHQHLASLDPQTYAALTALGIDANILLDAFRAPAPIISLSESLQPHNALNTPWRELYLGAVDGQYASIIRLYGVQQPATLAAQLAQEPCSAHSCVRLIDKPAHLNALFAQTRNQAAWLKILSWTLAWLALIGIFGLRRGSLILALPFIAVLASMGALSWLGIPIGLFALFGLLLASAIGVDYSVYILAARDSANAKLASMSLAALTTAISFILLASSQTPAVAAFGWAVSLGVGWNWLFAVMLLLYNDKNSYFDKK